MDLARGTPADTAALRERSGYYALVEELLALEDLRAGPATTATPSAVTSPPRPPLSRRPSRRRRRCNRRPSLPRAGASPPRPRWPSESPHAAARAQAPTPATPRGRFTQGELQRAPLESLEAPAGRATLESLLAQYSHRIALLHALAHGYTGQRGEPSAPELDELLARHGLLEAVEASERELLLSALSENRGALGRVAWALGLRGPELAALVSRLGLGPEVDRLRERFRKEALTPPSWTARLDLLGRRKYLEDLGLEREFEDRLRGDLGRENPRPRREG